MKDKTAFKVGDKIRHRFEENAPVQTVTWVCKGNYDRTEQVIATELTNGRVTDACLYERATDNTERLDIAQFGRVLHKRPI